MWVQYSTKKAEVHFRNEIYLYPLVFGGVVTLGKSCCEQVYIDTFRKYTQQLCIVQSEPQQQSGIVVGKNIQMNK